MAKKFLTVFLSVLMLCSCFSVSAFAEGTVAETPWHGPAGSGKPATYEQVVVQFNLMGGTLKLPQNVYDMETGKFVCMENITGTYTMVPENSKSMREGYVILLPAVVAPKGYQFDYWKLVQDPSNSGLAEYVFGGNSVFILPVGSAGTVMCFEACYSRLHCGEIHTDADNDGKCDICGKDLGTKPPAEEEPKPDNSFAGKIKAFFDRIINWFKDLFKIK